MDFAPACPYSPAGPVSSITTPTVIGQSAALVATAPPITSASVVEIISPALVIGLVSPLKWFVVLDEAYDATELRLYFMIEPCRPVRSRSRV